MKKTRLRGDAFSTLPPASGKTGSHVLEANRSVCLSAWRLTGQFMPSPDFKESAVREPVTGAKAVVSPIDLNRYKKEEVRDQATDAQNNVVPENAGQLKPQLQTSPTTSDTHQPLLAVIRTTLSFGVL